LIIITIQTTQIGSGNIFSTSNLGLKEQIFSNFI